MASTKAERQLAATALAKKWNDWQKMTDTDLFTEMRKEVPSITAASRDEMLRYLTFWHIEQFLIK